MVKKISVIAICILMLFSGIIFTGCKKDDGSKNGPDNPVNTATQSDGDEYVAPDVNYGGKDFNVMTWTLSEDWILEMNTELNTIDTQTYYHLKTVEEELGIKFNIAIQEKGGYYDMDNFVNRIYMLSGDDAVDLVCQYSLAASVGTQQGLYEDLTNTKYIRWDADYWSQDLKEANTVNGKIYYCTGDLTGSVLKMMFIMTFNVDMASDAHMGDIYQTVRDGKWTIEELKRLSASIYSDDNRNDIADVGDTFGFVVGDYIVIDAFQYGANLNCLEVNSLGELEINRKLYTDYGVSVCEKLKDLMHNNTGAYCNTKDRPVYIDAINTGKAVFQPTIVDSVIKGLAKTDINYGILPIPKYDADQEEYHTTLAMGYSMFSIPSVASDADMSSAVLESMAHDGYVNLNPVIFKALQYRYSNRSEDTEMLQILRDGISYDSGRILNAVDIFALVRRTVRDNAQITTYYAESSSKFKAGLNEINFAFS